uniref:Uncharacterized protein n=1 Tax=Oryza barthii TaxID=65489 RepID=A0A0D3GLX2_9ORYZ
MESSRAAEACLLIRSTALLVPPAAHDGDGLRGRGNHRNYFTEVLLLLGTTTKAMPWQLRLG